MTFLKLDPFFCNRYFDGRFMSFKWLRSFQPPFFCSGSFVFHSHLSKKSIHLALHRVPIEREFAQEILPPRRSGSANYESKGGKKKRLSSRLIWPILNRFSSFFHHNLAYLQAIQIRGAYLETLDLRSSSMASMYIRSRSTSSMSLLLAQLVSKRSGSSLEAVTI